MDAIPCSQAATSTAFGLARRFGDGGLAQTVSDVSVVPLRRHLGGWLLSLATEDMATKRDTVDNRRPLALAGRCALHKMSPPNREHNKQYHRVLLYIPEM